MKRSDIPYKQYNCASFCFVTSIISSTCCMLTFLYLGLIKISSRCCERISLRFVARYRSYQNQKETWRRKSCFEEVEIFSSTYESFGEKALKQQSTSLSSVRWDRFIFLPLSNHCRFSCNISIVDLCSNRNCCSLLILHITVLQQTYLYEKRFIKTDGTRISIRYTRFK